MYKLFAPLVLLIGLLACNSGEPAKEAPREKAPETSQHEGHEEEQGPSGLSLNNGAKWNADSSTNLNVAALQKIAAGFKKDEKDALPAYTALADELQAGLDKLISQCRMKGPDHDALHLWLEPLLKETAELKKSTSAEQGEKTFKSIENRLEEYNSYFE